MLINGIRKSISLSNFNNTDQLSLKMLKKMVAVDTIYAFIFIIFQRKLDLAFHVNIADYSYEMSSLIF